MEHRPVPPEGTDIMNHQVCHPHLHIHKGITGSIVQHFLLMGRMIPGTTDSFNNLIPKGHLNNA